MRTNKTGTLWYLSQLLTRGFAHGTKSTCYDYVGSRSTDNTFELIHDTRYVALLNGVKPPSGSVVFTNYPCDWQVAPYSTLTKYPKPSQSALDAFAVTAAARTNPSVPHISVPTFVGELRDIPETMKIWGAQLKKLGPKYWTKAAANGLLTWKFGIRPFLGDLRKMAAISEAIAERIRMLQKLQESRTLKRRCSLESDDSSVTASSKTTIQSQGAIVKAYRDVAYTKRVWATTRWKLAPSAVLPSEPEASWLLDAGPLTIDPKGRGGLWHRFSLAERLVLGLTAYEAFATLWELTPWSWFVDWFSGVGDWIAANNNTLPLTIQGICVMRHLTSMTSYRYCPPPDSADWVTVKRDPWTEKEERKERYVFTSLPSVLTLLPSLPCLTAGQLSILGSLTVVKSGGSIPNFRRLRR